MSGGVHRLTLPDGRRLAFDLYGPADGRPLILFHGTPSSRSGWHVFGDEALAHRLGLRVISPDRPGVGDSDWQPGRRLADWPADVTALAGHLGLERFAVLGYSGGGPYVVACALAIPDRLAAAGIVGGTGPNDELDAAVGVNPMVLRTLRLARDRPQLAERVFALMGLLATRAPQWMVAQAMTALPGADRTVLARRSVRQAVLNAFLDALRPGPRGVRLDTALMIGPWGLDPRAVPIPIGIWHGEDDRMVSPAAVRHLASLLPQTQTRFFSGEGHLSLLVNHGEEILAELVAVPQMLHELAPAAL